MSIRLMSLVWEISFPTQSQKLIALKLADYASDLGGSIFPAVNTIAEHVGCDERTVQRVLKAFRAAGLLHLVKDGGTGPKATNHWQLDVPALNALSAGKARVVGGANELEMEGDGIVEGESVDLSKGDILSSKGDILSGDEPVRVTNCRLRVTPVSAKGDTGVTQSFTNRQIELPSSAGAPATLRAARQALKVKAGDLSWSEWLEAIENHLGADARRSAARAGAIEVSARWPRPGVPMPALTIVRDTTGADA